MFVREHAHALVYTVYVLYVFFWHDVRACACACVVFHLCSVCIRVDYISGLFIHICVCAYIVYVYGVYMCVVFVYCVCMYAVRVVFVPVGIALIFLMFVCEWICMLVWRL